MIWALGAAGLGLLALPAMLRPLGRRLRPGRWSALCAVALLAGVTLVVAAGALASLPTVLRIVGLPQGSRACEAVFGHLSAPLALVGLGSMALSVLPSALALGRFRQTTKQAWVEGTIGHRLEGPGPFEVVVLDNRRLEALSVPGRRGYPGQVLLTTGLMGALAPDELDLVCAHEKAHLRLRHHRYLALATAVDAGLWWWPPAGASARALRLALERWADETAVGEAEGARPRLAAALLAVATESERPYLAAFSTVDGLIERVAAMQTPPKTAVPFVCWPVLWLPGMTMGAVTLYALGRLGHSAYCVVTMTGAGCHLT